MAHQTEPGGSASSIITKTSNAVEILANSCMRKPQFVEMMEIVSTLKEKGVTSST